jgi:hypothetical protein
MNEATISRSEESPGVSPHAASGHAAPRVAHAVRDPNVRAYNRTAYLPERRAMMQQWSDYLDELKAGPTVG